MAPYAPPANANYAEVSVPEHVNIRVVMKHLYRFTEKSGCRYLWADFQRRVIEIWGSEESIPRAIRLIRKKIVQLEHGVMEVYGGAKMFEWEQFIRIKGDKQDVLELANQVLLEHFVEIVEMDSNNILFRKTV